MAVSLRTFKRVFLAGLTVAATAMGFVIAGRVSTVGSAAYLLIAVLHIGLLAALARGMDEADRAAAPVWLYTAGFLHTLIALGVAIATAGLRLRSGGADDLVGALGSILVPMGTAVLPHFLGVLTGQYLERPGTQTGQVYELMVERLTRQAEQGYQSLDKLFSRREALLRQEITLMEMQVNHWRQSERALGTMIARVNALSTEIERAAHQSSGLSGSLTTAAAEARSLSPALQETRKVVGDLRELQQSIVELLQQPIFHRK